MKVTSSLAKVTDTVLWETLPVGTVILTSYGAGKHWLVVRSGDKDHTKNLIMGLEDGFSTDGAEGNRSYIVGKVLPAGTEVTLVVE